MVARHLESRGIEAVLGGVAWERFPVDPFPGPRPADDIIGGRHLDGAVIVEPDEGATTPEGAHFCESRLAGFLGRRTVLIDLTRGPAAAAAGMVAAAHELGCDRVCLVDIGGDAIAAGHEPGLASPLCDAVMIAAGAHVEELEVDLWMLGTGCDGELTPAEVMERVSALAAAGAWLGAVGASPDVADEIERAAAVAITEASLLVAKAARGVHGPVEIRGGRRTVELSPIAAIAFRFALAEALTVLPLARAVMDVDSIQAGRDALNDMGVSTELDYEERRAAETA